MGKVNILMAFDREEVFKRLRKVLMNLLKVFHEKSIDSQPKIDWGTDIVDDLGIDSVETLDLLNAIEEEFQVNPNISEANTKRKISQIVDYIIEIGK